MLAKLLLADDPDIWGQISRERINGLDHLAPVFRKNVAHAFNECHNVDSIEVRLLDNSIQWISLDPVVHETFRTEALQAIYYRQGTSKAKTPLGEWEGGKWKAGSWHGYKLAVDVISAEYEWFTGRAAKIMWPAPKEREYVAVQWFTAIADIFKQYNIDWGGDWSDPDLPHFQHGTLKSSPSPLALELYKSGGFTAVWEAVGAAL
jgi:hypothetical protein